MLFILLLKLLQLCILISTWYHQFLEDFSHSHRYAVGFVVWICFFLLSLKLKQRVHPNTDFRHHQIIAYSLFFKSDKNNKRTYTAHLWPVFIWHQPYNINFKKFLPLPISQSLLSPTIPPAQWDFWPIDPIHAFSVAHSLPVLTSFLTKLRFHDPSL